jgi:hypothetical protein
MTEKSGTFVVTHADDDSAVLKDVDDGQVHTLSSNPGVAAGDAVEATVAAEPPLEVTWTVVEVEERRSMSVEVSDLSPTTQEKEIAGDQAEGEMTRQERAGEGEIHVFTLPPGETDEAVRDVADDEATLTRAARLGVERVEIRAENGVLSVRYLP